MYSPQLASSACSRTLRPITHNPFVVELQLTPGVKVIPDIISNAKILSILCYKLC